MQDSLEFAKWCQASLYAYDSDDHYWFKERYGMQYEFDDKHYTDQEIWDKFKEATKGLNAP